MTYEGHSLLRRKSPEEQLTGAIQCKAVNILSLLFMAQKGAERKETTFSGGLAEGCGTVNTEKGEV